MRSDERIERASMALDEARSAFLSSVSLAVEEVDALLARDAAPVEELVRRTAVELGAFADGRMDPERFATLVAQPRALDPESGDAVRRARQVLSDIAARTPEDFFLDLAPGADLRGAVDRALIRFGRAFGAARLARAVRAGRYSYAEHEAALRGFPFGRWTASERRVAPPLVVRLYGADLRGAGLTEFLDGAVRIALFVDGSAPPAALVRLISPSVFVAQTDDIGIVDRVASAGGPAVAAVVEEPCARFVHDPAGGGTLADRLSVDFLPETTPRGRCGSATLFQQREELAQLAELAHAAAASVALPGGEPTFALAGGSGPTPPSDPAGRLAAWLLRQADLPATGDGVPG